MSTAPSDETRPGLVRPRRVDPTGQRGPTPRQARGRAYRRTSRGLFVPAAVSDDVPDQRILEAACAVPDAVVTGWAALRWWGGSWFGGMTAGGTARLPVPLATRRKHRPPAGTVICQEGWWPEEETCLVDGIRVTAPARSLFFEMRRVPSLAEAVIAVDMACYSDLVTLEEMAAYAASHGPRTGVGQARRAALLGDENSWSPQETRTRMAWTRLAGLPPVLCNHPVFDRDGRHLGTPDLLEPAAGVTIEYDGAVHLAVGQRVRDRNREEAFRAVGLECLTVVADELATEATYDRMRAVHARARFEAPETRAWTIEPPPWWTPTHTVAHRRALASTARAALLAYRRAG